MTGLELVLAFGLAQAAATVPEASEPNEEAYLVDDPFDIEGGEAPGVSAEPQPPAQSEARAAASRERLICRSRPELNTRTRRLRVCMTAAEWELHAVNMEQQRRDINDWGAQGGPGVN